MHKSVDCDEQLRCAVFPVLIPAELVLRNVRAVSEQLYDVSELWTSNHVYSRLVSLRLQRDIFYSNPMMASSLSVARLPCGIYSGRPKITTKLVRSTFYDRPSTLMIYH